MLIYKRKEHSEDKHTNLPKKGTQGGLMRLNVSKYFL